VSKRRNFHRLLFLAAGIYNITWGLFSAADPQWLFHFAKMPLDNHPQIFACLAMVIGLYGVIYFEIARIPERGFVLALVGFVGKILGPIGLAQLILGHTWPPATIVLTLSNDLIWLIPFGIYLYDSWPYFRNELASWAVLPRSSNMG
jgi:hypothetical protein